MSKTFSKEGVHEDVTVKDSIDVVIHECVFLCDTCSGTLISKCQLLHNHFVIEVYIKRNV